MDRRYAAILFPALLGLIPTFFLGLATGIIVYILGIVPLIFLFIIFFVPMGILIGRFFPEQSWKPGIGLSLAYSIWLGYALISTFAFNIEHHDVFLRIEFFPVAVFLYLSPVIIACASTNVGSNFSRRSVSFVLLAVALTLAAAAYVGYGNISASERNTFSFDLIENNDLHLRAEITCESMTGKNYMRFFNTDRTDCSYTKIFVLKKPLHYPLPLTISVTTDGVEESHPISPQLDSTGDVFGIDASKRQDFDNTRIWLAWVPWYKIVRGQRVSFRWGEINFEFGESEFKYLREIMGR